MKLVEVELIMPLMHFLFTFNSPTRWIGGKEDLESRLSQSGGDILRISQNPKKKISFSLSYSCSLRRYSAKHVADREPITSGKAPRFLLFLF